MPECEHDYFYTGRLVDCKTCKGNVRLKVHQCKKCNHTIQGNPVGAVRRQHEREERSSRSYKRMISPSLSNDQQANEHEPFPELYPGILDPIPDQWEILKGDEFWVPIDDPTWSGRHKVCNTYVEALRKLANLPLPEPKHIEDESECVLYVGGNGNNLPTYAYMISLNIKDLRNRGYKGRIQWWWNSAVEYIPNEYLEGIREGIEFRDFQNLQIKNRVLGGWWNKLLAFLHCESRYVVFADADCNILESVEPLFSFVKKHPFCFWSKERMDARVWMYNWLGADSLRGIRPVNGGHLLIDRLKAWRLLVIAFFIGQHKIYFDPNFGHAQHRDYIYGEECAHYIAQACVNKWGTRIPVTWLGQTKRLTFDGFGGNGLMLQCDFQGKPYFAHRIHPKLHPDKWNAPTCETYLPGNAELFSLHHGYVLKAPNWWHFRIQHDSDVWIYRESVTDNQYKMPAFKEDDVVIDVGGHVGTASYKAYLNGSRNIHTFEPHPANFKVLEYHVTHFEGCTIYQKAVWNGPETTKRKILTPWRIPNNTGDAELVESGEGIEVEVVEFDEFLKQFDRIAFVKLDAEKMEKDTLLTTSMLPKIDRISAELHLPGEWDCVSFEIKDRLEQHGFVVDLDLKLPDVGQGLLFAVKKHLQ